MRFIADPPPRSEEAQQRIDTAGGVDGEKVDAEARSSSASPPSRAVAAARARRGRRDAVRPAGSCRSASSSLTRRPAPSRARADRRPARRRRRACRWRCAGPAGSPRREVRDQEHDGLARQHLAAELDRPAMWSAPRGAPTGRLQAAEKPADQPRHLAQPRARRGRDQRLGAARHHLADTRSACSAPCAAGCTGRRRHGTAAADLVAGGDRDSASSAAVDRGLELGAGRAEVERARDVPPSITVSSRSST